MTTTGKPVEKTATVITARDLELLGGGEVAYIRTLTSEEATRFYPDVEDLPPGLELFALHAADGSPIALTDSFDAAVGHAIDGDLSIASVH
jgi:hypothetical protein